MRSQSDGQSPVCQCGEDARLLTVRKEGPNTGRLLVILLSVRIVCLLMHMQQAYYVFITDKTFKVT